MKREEFSLDIGAVSAGMRGVGNIVRGYMPIEAPMSMPVQRLEAEWRPLRLLRVRLSEIDVWKQGQIGGRWG